jgi:hypothetical protein
MRLKEKNISSGPVQFEKHPPERRRGVGGYLFCGGGCCCCCCCLHSLGGLIGAAAAAKSKSPSKESVVRCYWAFLVLLAGAIFIFTLASTQSGVEGFSLIVALLFLPLVQLLASFLTWLWIGIRSAAFPDRKASLQILGKITLRSFLWAVAGGIVMIVAFKMFN